MSAPRDAAVAPPLPMATSDVGAAAHADPAAGPVVEAAGAAARDVRRRWKVPAAADPRWAFAGLLLLYAALGCTVLGFNRGPAQILLTVGGCCALDALLAYLLRRELLFPLSACITGLSLALQLNYAHGSALFLIPVWLAIGSKYLFTFKGRHVFNPSLFGLAASLLLAGHLIEPAPAYQWGGPVAASAFLVMGALCLFVFRIGRAPLIVSFLVLYTLQTALRAWLMRWHLPPETLFAGTLTSTPFFLFTFYMLTDPATSPSKPRDQVLTALAVTVVDLALHKVESLYTFYYAAFAVAAGRLLFLHAREIVETRGRRLREFRGAALKPAAVVGGLGLAGWLVSAGTAGAVAETVDPGFRFESLPAAATGVTMRLGRTLEEVDPRVRHIAKWILSQGNAVATGDFDGDGLLDLFVTSPLAAPEDRAVLYRNLGGLRFRRVPVPCLEPVVRDASRFGLISGALFVDYDNDGDPDLFLPVGFGQCRMLRNELVERGKPSFADATETAGIRTRSVCLAAQFFDMDRDGRLDLLVANAMAPYLADYGEPTPLNLFKLPQPAYPGDRRMFHFMHSSWYDATNSDLKSLYLNLGGGRFARVDSAQRGMPETHWSLAIGTADLNRDGWTDLYVANDFGPDDLYLNRQGRGFQRVQGAFVGEIGRDTYKGMNASIGDLDNDGSQEIYVSDVHEPLQSEGSLCWTVRPGRRFVPEIRDDAARRGLLNEHRFGWGAAMGDVNGDGFLDLLQANGMVDDTPDRRYVRCPDYWYVNEKVMRAGPEIHSYADLWGDLRGRCIFGREANRVYLNRGPQAHPQFADAAEAAGWTEQTSSRGIALADLDNDGDLDALVTHPFAPLSVYRNTLHDGGAAGQRGWIGLRLTGDGRTCSREAVGTKVTLSYRQNGREVRQSREVQLANGFSAQGDRRLLFGLGDYRGPVVVTVRWYGAGGANYALAPARYYSLRQLQAAAGPQR